jgi:dihydropteroate synthase
VNDISGGRDPELFELAADRGCGYVLMHIEGPPREDREPPGFDDPVDHLKGWFAERIEAALAAGMDEEQIAVDPGIDFDLGVADGLEVLRRLGELRDLGRPVYASLSRKDLLGAVLAGSWDDRLPAGEREWATCAATTLAVAAGASVHRLHDASALQAMRIAAAIQGGEAAARPYAGAVGA